MSQVSRRYFLGASMALAGASKSVFAQSKPRELVVCSPGGSYTEAQREAIYKPFEKEFRVKIIETGPTDYGKLKAMVDSKNVEWDIFDATDRKLFGGVAEGLFEPLDFQTIDVKDVIPEAVNKHGVGVILSSTVLAHNTKKYKAGSAPQSWAEFWDVKRFPGARTLQKSPDDNLVFALLADGVDMKNLYPLDIPRAFKSLDRIKKHVNVWWNTGAQSEQIFVNGEVDLGAIWNGRATVVGRQGAPIAFDWNQGQVHIDYWAIPKGSPNKDLAMQFIAFANQPRQQAELVKRMPYGPVNRKALSLLDAATLNDMSSSPQNIAKQSLSDGQYWAKHFDEVNKAWQAWLIS